MVTSPTLSSSSSLVDSGFSSVSSRMEGGDEEEDQTVKHSSYSSATCGDIISILYIYIVNIYFILIYLKLFLFLVLMELLYFLILFKLVFFNSHKTWIYYQDSNNSFSYRSFPPGCHGSRLWDGQLLWFLRCAREGWSHFPFRHKPRPLVLCPCPCSHGSGSPSTRGCSTHSEPGSIQSSAPPGAAFSQGEKGRGLKLTPMSLNNNCQVSGKRCCRASWQTSWALSGFFPLLHDFHEFDVCFYFLGSYHFLHAKK